MAYPNLFPLSVDVEKVGPCPDVQAGIRRVGGVHDRSAANDFVDGGVSKVHSVTNRNMCVICRDISGIQIPL